MSFVRIRYSATVPMRLPTATKPEPHPMTRPPDATEATMITPPANTTKKAATATQPLGFCGRCTVGCSADRARSARPPVDGHPKGLPPRPGTVGGLSLSGPFRDSERTVATPRNAGINANSYLPTHLPGSIDVPVPGPCAPPDVDLVPQAQSVAEHSEACRPDDQPELRRNRQDEEDEAGDREDRERRDEPAGMVTGGRHTARLTTAGAATPARGDRSALRADATSRQSVLDVSRCPIVGRSETVPPARSEGGSGQLGACGAVLKCAM